MNGSRYDVVKLIEAVDNGLDAVRLIVVRAGPRQVGTGLIHLLREVCFDASRVELVDAYNHIGLSQTTQHVVDFLDMLKVRSEQTTLVVVAYPAEFDLFPREARYWDRAVVVDVRDEYLPINRAEYLTWITANETVSNHVL